MSYQVIARKYRPQTFDEVGRLSKIVDERAAANP